jgi:cell division septal protein FtsQ
MTAGLACLVSLVPFVISRFQVRTIYIEADPVFFTTTSLFSKPQNLLFISTKKFAAEILKALPILEDVSITKQFPDTLHIVPKLRSVVAMVASNQEKFYVGDGGYVLPVSSSAQTQTYPTISCSLDRAPVGEIVHSDSIKTAVEIISPIEHELKLSISTITCELEQSLKIKTSAFIIIISDKQDITHAISSLQYLQIQFRIEGRAPVSIDLRFEKPVLRYIDAPFSATPSSELK